MGGSSADRDQEAQGEPALQLLNNPDVSTLARLKNLTLSNLDLQVLPDSIAACGCLEKLDLSNNSKLGTLPATLSQLSHLRILFAARIGLAELPPVLSKCKQLRMLGVRENQLTCIDGESLPESLVWLIAASNKIDRLPNIARLKHIRKLMLSNNQLTCAALAPVAGIEDLEMIRVAENKLEAFPDELLAHKKLAWVAVGSNPFTNTTMDKLLHKVPAMLDFSEVEEKGDKLGSGAGATVYKATWRGQGVALKLWENVRASDGTAQGEWAANCVAGAPGDDALVRIHGALQKPLGMVMELFEGAVQAASPPSFSTVTRDALPKDGGKGPTYTAASALTVARNVAQACAYLQSKGLHHGDVYLHNTLVVLDGGVQSGACVRDVRLSDLGAAAALEEPTARAMEKLEVRSFGWLIQDLLESLEPPAQAPENEARPEIRLLNDLRKQCAAEAVSEIPLFKDLVAALSEKPEAGSAKKARSSM